MRAESQVREPLDGNYPERVRRAGTGGVPRVALLAALALLGAACSNGGGSREEGDGRGAAARSTSVWAIDLVRTMPGAQADYIWSIRTNWAAARRLAGRRGVVLSYRAFRAAPDSARGWDVLLLTEYADSAAYMNREEVFQEIFNSLEFARVEPARPLAELRTFAASAVLREFASSGP